MASPDSFCIRLTDCELMIFQTAVIAIWNQTTLGVVLRPQNLNASVHLIYVYKVVFFYVFKVVLSAQNLIWKYSFILCVQNATKSHAKWISLAYLLSFINTFPWYDKMFQTFFSLNQCWCSYKLFNNEFQTQNINQLIFHGIGRFPHPREC